MDVGIRFPQNEVGPDVVAVRDFAQTAEGLGYDYLLRGDHVIGAAPSAPTREGRYSANFIYHEPLVFFSYLAAITSRLRFITGVMILPQRQTVVVAKQAAELDFLSGGRLTLGAGVGWQEMEYEALNETFKNRGSRIVEQFAVLRALWTQETVTFNGRWHQIENAGINPMPVQRPIPLWMGGRSDVVLRRAARIADGWIVAWESGQPEEFELARPVWEWLQGYAAAAGRDAASLGLQGTINLARTSPDDWGKEMEGWRSLGATMVIAGAAGLGGSLSDHLDIIRRFKETVG